MKQQFTFTLLGTGSSGGVPRVGNQWGKCDPHNPKNRRRRCALLVELLQSGDADETTSADRSTTVLIDAGADLREQLLAAHVTYLDGVLLTHSHADHIFGLDDLRQLALSMKSAIPVYMDAATAEMVNKPFSYIFKQSANSSYPAFCTQHHIEHTLPVELSGAAGNIEAHPVLAEHGDINSLGFRIADVAYLPDMKRIANQESLERLRGLEVLIVDALRHSTHPSHMNLDEALAFIKQIKPKRAVLTNMHSDMDYKTLRQSLPESVEPGYDGMQIQVTA